MNKASKKYVGVSCKYNPDKYYRVMATEYPYSHPYISESTYRRILKALSVCEGDYLVVEDNATTLNVFRGQKCVGYINAR